MAALQKGQSSSVLPEGQISGDMNCLEEITQELPLSQASLPTVTTLWSGWDIHPARDGAESSLFQQLLHSFPELQWESQASSQGFQSCSQFLIF